jgi:predicted DNA-binding protein
MLQIELHPELEAQLARLSQETGRSQSSYVSEAVERFLEDEEDYRAGMAAVAKGGPRVTLEELERELGLEH